jgi:Transglutaminase-like superfamily
MKTLHILVLTAFMTLTGSACQRDSDGNSRKPGKPSDGMLAPDQGKGMTPAASVKRPRPRPTPKAKTGNNVLQLPNAKGVKSMTLAEANAAPYVKVAVSRVVALARKHCKTHWFGLFLRGKKLGYAEMGCRVTRWKGKEVLERTSRMVMQAQLYTTAVRLESKSVSRFDVKSGEMLLYDYAMKGSQQHKTLRVERKTGGWLVRRTYKAGAIVKPEEKKVLKTLKSNLGNGESAFSALLIDGKVKPGARYRYVEFDPEDATERDSAIQLLNTATRPLRGVKVKLHKLEMMEMHRRLRGVTVVDAEANWLDGLLQGTIRIRRAEKAVAKRVDPNAGDFGLGVVIKAASTIKKPSKVSELKLQMDGFLPASLTETKRHKLAKKGTKKAILTITRESVANLPTMTLPVTNKKYAAELKSTHNIESKHKDLRALAKRAVGGEKNALKAARKLNRFVYGYLRKSLSTNLDSALAIARARAGDCTEHARLLVALCRAVGLPAREVGGVTYVPDMGGFGYHAWVEVWVGRWITSDPSWNELPANATHIQMGGPNDVQWIGTLGALKIKVLSFK